MSRLNKLKDKMDKVTEIKIPEKKSDNCIGECDVQILGFDDTEKKPIIYCMGCGRKMGK